MPRVPGCDAVYEFADRWRVDCLERNGSLFWPEKTGWSLENSDQC